MPGTDQTPQTAEPLEALAGAVRACRICRDAPSGRPLPHEPRPVLRVSATARICVAGQAPGTLVHASGKPFTDPSGDRLRAWMGVDEATFYDVARIAIVPMGFCFPGQDARGGDLPPRRECAPAWQARLFASMPAVDLVIAAGAHAHRWHLGARNRARLTDTVAAWRDIAADRQGGGPLVFPIPHPSWRNNAWLKRHPWFAAELLPTLQAEVAKRL